MNGHNLPDSVAPPIGVMPARIWKEKRMQELARAIHEYVSGGYLSGGCADCVANWSHELFHLAEEIQAEERRRAAIKAIPNHA